MDRPVHLLVSPEDGVAVGPSLSAMEPVVYAPPNPDIVLRPQRLELVHQVGIEVLEDAGHKTWKARALDLVGKLRGKTQN